MLRKDRVTLECIPSEGRSSLSDDIVISTDVSTKMDDLYVTVQAVFAEDDKSDDIMIDNDR